MTKEEALQGFFESFGISAYPASSVPDDLTFPWMTYELVTGNWRGGNNSMTVNLWYYTTSEAVPNAKAEELGRMIDDMKPLECDEGYIWLKRGSPWCQSMTDATDPQIKRRYINVTVEYLTFY